VEGNGAKLGRGGGRKCGIGGHAQCGAELLCGRRGLACGFNWGGGGGVR